VCVIHMYVLRLRDMDDVGTVMMMMCDGRSCRGMFVSAVCTYALKVLLF
jgi:hypothetical protein